MSNTQNTACIWYSSTLRQSTFCPADALYKKSCCAGEGDGKARLSAELAGLQAMLRDLARSGNAQGDMIIALAGETAEQHSTGMRLQHTLAQECQAMAQRQERLAAELTAAQRGMLELRSSMPLAPLAVGSGTCWLTTEHVERLRGHLLCGLDAYHTASYASCICMRVLQHPVPSCKPLREAAFAVVQELQAVMDALRGEQANQREAIGTFTARLAAVDNKLQLCVDTMALLNKEHSMADNQLHSVRTAMTEQQAHLTELTIECDRRHETAMKMQQTMATETALIGQQVSTRAAIRSPDSASSPATLWFLMHAERARCIAARCCAQPSAGCTS